MAQGAFNVSRLIAELGLQNVTGEELRVLESIQPVLQVGDIGGNSPPHIPPASVSSALVVGGVGTFGSMNLMCLAPGGLFLDWFTFESGATSLNVFVRVGNPAPGMVVVPADNQVSNDPVVSVVTNGTAAAAVGGTAIFINTTTFRHDFSPHPWFIPRGSSVTFQSIVAGVTIMNIGLGFREVPASEHGS